MIRDSTKQAEKPTSTAPCCTPAGSYFQVYPFKGRGYIEEVVKYVLLILTLVVLGVGIKVNLTETSTGAFRFGFMLTSLGPGLILAFFTWRMFKKD